MIHLNEGKHSYIFAIDVSTSSLRKVFLCNHLTIRTHFGREYSSFTNHLTLEGLILSSSKVTMTINCMSWISIRISHESFHHVFNIAHTTHSTKWWSHLSGNLMHIWFHKVSHHVIQHPKHVIMMPAMSLHLSMILLLVMASLTMIIVVVVAHHFGC